MSESCLNVLGCENKTKRNKNREMIIFFCCEISIDSLLPRSNYTCTRAHAHERERERPTHINTHTHTHARTHTHREKEKHTHTHTHAHAQNTHTHTHTRNFGELAPFSDNNFLILFVFVCDNNFLILFVFVCSVCIAW